MGKYGSTFSWIEIYSAHIFPIIFYCYNTNYLIHFFQFSIFANSEYKFKIIFAVTLFFHFYGIYILFIYFYFYFGIRPFLKIQLFAINKKRSLE